jgi:hypothetical protein
VNLRAGGVPGRRRDLADEAMRGQAGEGLLWCRREIERGGGGGARRRRVARGEVPAGPGQMPVGATEDAPAPSEPPIVRVDPGAGVDQIVAVEAEIGREALEEEPFLVDDVSWLRRRPVWKEGADLGPGALRLAAVAGKDGERRRHLAPEVRIAGDREVSQDLVSLVPPSVEDQAAEPGQAGRDVGGERTSDAA